MVNSALERELHEHLEHLPEPKQREVVEYARGLSTEMPKGLSGKEFLAVTGTLEPDDLALTKQAIEEECERVDLDGW